MYIVPILYITSKQNSKHFENMLFILSSTPLHDDLAWGTNHLF